MRGAASFATQPCASAGGSATSELAASVSEGGAGAGASASCGAAALDVDAAATASAAPCREGGCGELSFHHSRCRRAQTGAEGVARLGTARLAGSLEARTDGCLRTREVVARVGLMKRGRRAGA